MCAKSLAMFVLVACVQGMHLQFQNSSLILFVYWVFSIKYTAPTPGPTICKKELFIACPHETDKLYLPRNACNRSEGIVAVLQLSVSIPIIKRY